ncbi:MAG: DUF5685 family protein [Clostridiales bacterium]|nr:DUF5685 family protein [Clostridiales bacterium]
MFGYVVVNEPELKIREYQEYRAYYCGLCRELKDRFGVFGQMTVSFDMTFLIMLLTGLYEPEEVKGTIRCIAHPVQKHPVIRNRYTGYAADMNVLLMYYKCQDDWADEHKPAKRVAQLSLEHAKKEIAARYPRKVKVIKKQLKEIRDCEQRQEKNIDVPAGAFGRILAELFAFQKDEWENDLRTMGFYLGKFIYLLDAWDDLEEDEASHSYNPFLLQDNPGDREEMCHQILVSMMAECSRAFERLPVIKEAPILRNILYSGVWSRYKSRKGRRHDDGSISGIRRQPECIRR